MLSQKLQKYLEDNKIPYEIRTHAIAYTASETAQCTHIPGKEFAKTVMVKVDDRLMMAVLPATKKLDLDLLRKNLSAKKLELASEDDFSSKFPECEVGAMPPFGNLYGVDVIAAKALTEDEEISFNAGTHTDMVKIRYDHFQESVQPRIVECSMDSLTPIEVATKLMSDIEYADLESCAHFLSDDFIFSGPVPEPLRKTEWMGMMQSMLTAIPDWSFNISDIQELDDEIRIRVQVSGTQTGDWDLSTLDLGLVKATGKSFELPVEHCELTIRDGKVIRFSVNDIGSDGGLIGILAQLGVKVPRKEI